MMESTDSLIDHATASCSICAISKSSEDQPLTVDWCPDDWEEGGTTTLPGLGSGTRSTQAHNATGLSLMWERVHTANGTAWRIQITNTTANPITIDSVQPLHLGSETPGWSEGGWRALRQPRHKNDMPAIWNLADTSQAAWDAFRNLYECGSITNTPDTALPERMTSSELLGLAGPTHCYLLAAVPVHSQLVTSWVAGDTQQPGVIAACGVVLHGDGCRVAPGDTWQSQWVILVPGDNLTDLCNHYAELLRAWYPEAATRHDAQPPRSVWCSWYYYGVMYRQEDARENLAAISAAGLPLDVIQIDDCWDDRWGDWNPGTNWSDIAAVASEIKAAGYQPGIWTGAFLAEPRSDLANRHPDWLLCTRDGEHIRFSMSGMASYVLDTTHPEVLAYLKATFERLTHQWGFTYHKVDFTRAVVHPDAAYHDPHCTSAEAYRRGLEAIRQGIGPDAYLNICGGLYGPSIGIADAQRTGADVRSSWPTADLGDDAEAEPYGPFTIKQNALRWWMHRLWNNDGDALMVRRNETPHGLGHLSLGQLSDDEALTCTLNQFLAGGFTCVSERMAACDPDRLALWRHCIPAHGSAATPIDLLDDNRFPTCLHTAHRGAAGSWDTIALINWYPEPRSITLHPAILLPHLNGSLHAAAHTAGWQRVLNTADALTIELRPHACEVIRFAQQDANKPVLVATDGHFSMGSEITRWDWSGETLTIDITWSWDVPLQLWIAAPTGRTFSCGNTLKQVTCAQSCTLQLSLA